MAAEVMDQQSEGLDISMAYEACLQISLHIPMGRIAYAEEECVDVLIRCRHE